MPANPPPAQLLPVEPLFDGLKERIAYVFDFNGCGAWTTCTGCHESNEGYPTGPFSDVLQCHLGGGCSECGGIGAVYDSTDWEVAAREMLAMDDEPSPESGELASLVEALADAAAISVNKGKSVVVDFDNAGEAFALYNLLVGHALSIGAKCSICGGTNFCRLDIQQFNGTFAPGPERRCVECKTTFTAQAYAALHALSASPEGRE